ncbi:MAG: ThuA domain-containing protein [Verrucomicrobia bacterium]|nr:ThuA domain-containing protein [Verrucomicrobiota bacterium]
MNARIRFVIATAWLALANLPAAEAKPHVVLLSGESLYDSSATLPKFAKRLEQRHGYRCTTIVREETHRFPSLDALGQADLVIVFARRMELPAEQLGQVKRYIDSGKPVIALRTASHAFQNWLEFDQRVLGGNYHGHHKNSLSGNATIVSAAKGHPILSGVAEEFKMGGSLYKNTPLAKSATPLLAGAVDGHPAEPVAWTHSYKGNRTFYTSLGHADDFANPNFTRLVTNAIDWCLGGEAKPSAADIAAKYGVEAGEPFRIGVALFEKMWRDDKLTLLDVRTTPEYRAGHLPGTEWIDWFSPDFAAEAAKLDKDKFYLVYCAGGVRSARACKKMSGMGFKYLVDLAPGFKGWKAAGKAIEK